MIIRTPDQRLRVFVSSTLQELAEERAAANDAITRLRLAPVMFELGARPHPPKNLYRSYLDQSHIFVGIYWERYGWVAPDMDISGLEDEYLLSGQRPKLIYVKTPAPNREPRLQTLLDRIRNDDKASYKPFRTAAELQQLLENDLAVLLTERFEMTQPGETGTPRSNRFGSLPAPSTALMGRDREVEQVIELLMKSDVRMVTLYGPGGIGKTRLAIEVGLRVRSRFTDGACFVPLSTVTDHNLVVPAIGQALGLGETRSAGLEDRVADTLHDKCILLILDNFEQVMPAAAQLGDLLSVAPGLDMLVTSRAVLRLRGEYEFSVPALPLPPSPDAPLATWRDCASVQLFMERATAVKPDFELTPENAPVIASICARLDGLPLAIELAASRVKVLTPQAILARLIDTEQQARLLSGGARDLPERQQTLRNTLDWSYDLLEVGEQTMFARLSTFVGGWTIEAGSAVSGHDSDELTVLDTLSSLADKSLIVRASRQGEERFTMLNTIRDYAAQRLAESGQVEESSRRHAAYFASLAHRAEPELRRASQHEWVTRLDADSGNLQAALTWLIDSGDSDTAVDVGWWLQPYWLITSRMSELLRWMVAALSRLDISPASPPRRVEARAKALAMAGLSASWQGNPDWATFLLSEAEALQARLPAPAPAISALISAALGTAAMYTPDFDTAQSHFDAGLRQYREAGDAWGASMVMSGIQQVALRRGDYDAAERVYREGYALAEALGDGVSLSLITFELGRMHLLRGNLAQAEEGFRKSITLAHGIGYREAIARCLEGLAAVARARDDYQRAAELLGAAHGVRDTVGLSLWQVEAPGYRELVAAVQAGAGDSYESASLRGVAMPIDAAVAFGLA
jgi:predicted ATPase